MDLSEFTKPMVGFKKSEPIPETKVLEAIRNSATLQRCAGRKDVKVVNECPLMAVISMGRCNTFTKTQNMARMLMNLKETLRFLSSRDRRAAGPLEASRGKSRGRAFDEPSIVCLSPVGLARGDRDPSTEE